MGKQVWYLHQIIIFNTSISNYLKKNHLLKFFRQNNYTEKAKILYFLNLVYFLSLVGLWQNHVLYWSLTGLMWRNRMPFGKSVVNKCGSVCHYYWYFVHGTLHMWARIDEEHNLKEKHVYFSNMKKIIKHYPMTDRLIVIWGYMLFKIIFDCCTEKENSDWTEVKKYHSNS
jgi:hypothetical protein